MKNILLLLLVLLTSCKSSLKMEGRYYELTDIEQIVSLDFINDSICIVKQRFLCENLPNEFKFIEDSRVKYRREKLRIAANKRTLHFNVLVMENLKYKRNTNSNPGNYTIIPNYNELGCSKLLERELHAEKLKTKINTGFILNLVHDTIITKKDLIIFGYKKIPRIR